MLFCVPNGSVSDRNNTAERGEPYLFWHHLMLAGLVEGSFTGLIMVTISRRRDSWNKCTNFLALGNAGYSETTGACMPQSQDYGMLGTTGGQVDR